MVELALQQVVNGLLVGAIYAVMALGLMVILGILNVINMAQGELYMLGGYFAYFAIALLGVDYFTSIGLAMIATAGAGVVVERLAVRPLLHRSVFTVFLSTFAVSMMLQDLAQIVWTPDPREIPTPFAPQPIVLGPIFLTAQRIFILLVAVGVIGGFAAFLRWSRVGMAMRALAKDRDADLVRLGEARRAPARALSYGSQRGLELAVALATRCRLLLLDEPAAGLNPEESDYVRETILGLRDRGLTIVVIEHDMRLVMGLSDRIVVLNHGEKIAEGPPPAIVADSRVVEAYLGSEAAHA